MDNQDKIFKKIKDAAHSAETKEFPAMDKIWSRVEEKLDKKEDKKTIALWKQIAVAASLLLLFSLGFQFLKTDQTANTETNTKVVISDAKEKSVQEPIVEKTKIEVAENPKIVSKTEAEKILNNQIKQKQPVALQEVKTSADTFTYPTSSIQVQEEISVKEPILSSAEVNEETSEAVATNKSFSASKKTNLMRESYRISNSQKESQIAQKGAPLIIMNGKAISHSNDDKRDKMMQAELPNLSPENVESLVILEEPLYIIDGIYYSENDLFGSNPTSPYAPLNKQEIKTITILQDLEATSKYGDKGKKGVVIITTKTGKPATQN